jgi:hypothetical protein
MGIDSFDAGTLGVNVDRASLVVRYKVASDYTGSQSVMWSTNEGGSAASTGITPAPGEIMFVESSFDLHAIGVTTTNAISTLDISFLNDGTTGQVQFDSISIVVSIGPEAYIYRWANVTVGDEYGVPIPGANVSAVFTGSDTYGGQPSFYFGEGGATPLPPDSVLSYMGKDASTFGMTESDGIVMMPYLTDMITGPEAPNSLFVGSLSITGSALISGTVYSSTRNLSFTPYPAMTSADQRNEFTVSIVGVSAPSPDLSRWLVVPPSMIISDITYYHAGDVIVAAGGTLRIEDAVFEIVQKSQYQRTVYVDNATASGSPGAPALMVIESSIMRSSMQMNVNVKGYATLAVFNSTLQGINIVADEHATVVLMNSTMDGKITTGWDSYAEITVKDSDLSQSPILSGQSIGSFTNASAPSIVVQDDAVGLIYRWIHITVLDGAGKPLPGVLVSTRYYINNTPANSAVSSAAPDSLGVAKVNALSTILTSVRERFVNNYIVNATYTFPGVTDPFYADDEKAESVLPYYSGQALGRNATYDTMTISDVLPLLIGNGTNPVWANISYPKLNQNVTIYAEILNDGYSSAYNVEVYFYDDQSLDLQGQPNELFGIGTIPSIRAGETAITQVYWNTVGPVDPEVHTILAVIDPQRLVTEIGETSSSALKYATGEIIVRNLPDISVESQFITTNVSVVIVDSIVTITADIRNLGSNRSAPVTVEFFDGATSIGTVYLAQGVPAGNHELASVEWTFTEIRAHTIRVVASLGVGNEELDYGNNEAQLLVGVLNHPDLRAVGPLTTSPPISVAGGQPVSVTVKIENLNPAPFSNPDVWLFANYTEGTDARSIQVYRLVQDVTMTSSSGPVDAVLTFIAPTLAARTDMSLVAVVNLNNTQIESSRGNNIVTGSIVILDVRPDLAVSSDDIYVSRSGTNITGATFGRVVIVNALIHNLGGSDASDIGVEVGVRNIAGTYNHTIYNVDWYNVSYITPNNTVLVSVSWTVNLTTSGAYEVWVRLDSANSISEPDEANNFASDPFTVQPLLIDVSMTLDAEEYKAGDTVVISASIAYAGTNDPVKRLPGVVFWLIDSTTSEPIVGSDTAVQTTDDTGSIVALLVIPSDISGSFKVRAVVLDQHADSTATIHVSQAVSGGLFPWWVWVLIIVAVVGVVAGFTVYTYVYGLGKLVECGECGAFIPAASKRCPKCGVEFEAGTMKCSECGAWIPAESTECPNCGVKFVGAPEEEADYMERMRKEYDEMLGKYRELAKPELGKKYSEKAFDAWWKAQPGYISFEDWLAKEEEKKKEGPIACPVCGTLNPKEATVCHKCGTVFGAAKVPPEKKAPPPAGPPAAVEAAPAEKPAEAGAPPAAAPRMVIRRPIDRKVVPKKIIKTPVGGEENNQSGSGGEDENQ